MDINTAESAGIFVARIHKIQQILANLDTAINESWPISGLIAVAPAEGASVAAGTTVDLTPTGSANTDLAIVAFKAAQAGYQAQLSTLLSQLDAIGTVMPIISDTTAADAAMKASQTAYQDLLSEVQTTSALLSPLKTPPISQQVQ